MVIFHGYIKSPDGTHAKNITEYIAVDTWSSIGYLLFKVDIELFG